MWGMMWIYAAFILSLTEARSRETETNQTTPVNVSPYPHPFHDVRHSAFNLGSDVNLICSNKTLSDTIYVIWKIHLKHKYCTIAFSMHDPIKDTCDDGKSLRNTSSAQSFLHIPNFSSADVGTYTCESAYKGGSDNHEINVAITVPPKISSCLEYGNNKIVAICKADKGKPAANISWRHDTLNSTAVETRTDSDGFLTVESRLELLEGVDVEKLRCAISHPYWPEEQILEPKLQQGYFPWLCIIIAATIVVLLIGLLFFVREKQFLRRRQQSNTSPSKSAPSEDVEEVEPYASYVQRVNSIYNSSAELFT